jgi:6-pyruvoyltetrahydropterin/6-carboxytetrahydropterin synthase
MIVAMSYRISVERNRLRFAAAHFATFGGDLEPLHGHNYQLMVEIEGSLTPDSWVVDFGDAKRLVRDLCHRLDHKFLLATASPHLAVSHNADSYEITFGDRRYIIPEADVAPLDIDNTTAERLAEWFASRLAAKLAELGADNVMSISVGVEEMPGQAGWFTLRIR